MTFGNLFAGIGGFDYGLERAGMRCVWQVENDRYARKILQKHWPSVSRSWDVCNFPERTGFARPDLICGGFPCQDISSAGHGAGIGGERSGLWREFARIVGVFRPRYVLVENSPLLTVRGLGRILGDLAACGYDAEWQCLPAAAFGAPHLRWRMYVVAYRAGKRVGELPTRPGRQKQTKGQACGGGEKIHGANTGQQHGEAGIFGPSPKIMPVIRPCWGTDQPGVDRASYGVHHRVDRIRGLGNAVVPQVAEWIGLRIMEHAKLTGAAQC